MARGRYPHRTHLYTGPARVRLWADDQLPGDRHTIDGKDWRLVAALNHAYINTGLLPLRWLLSLVDASTQVLLRVTYGTQRFTFTGTKAMLLEQGITFAKED